MLECQYCGEEDKSVRQRVRGNILCNDCDAFLNYGDYSRPTCPMQV